MRRSATKPARHLAPRPSTKISNSNINNRCRRYGEQQQNYQYDRQRYAQDVRNYDLAQYAWSYPAPYAYRYGDEYGLQPL